MTISNQYDVEKIIGQKFSNSQKSEKIGNKRIMSSVRLTSVALNLISRMIELETVSLGDLRLVKQILSDVPSTLENYDNGDSTYIHTMKTAATFLQISVTQMRRLIDAGFIAWYSPTVQKGKSRMIRIRQEALEKYIADSEVEQNQLGTGSLKIQRKPNRTPRKKNITIPEWEPLSPSR